MAFSLIYSFYAVACPNSIFVREEDRCDRVTAAVVLIVIVEADKASVEATLLSAVTAATNDGRFQETLEKVNPDIQITVYRDNGIPAPPSQAPSQAPTISTSPTSAPTIRPSGQPSISLAPSTSYTPTTSIMPSAQPSISLAPSTSFRPSFRPSVSLAPSVEPTDKSAPPTTMPTISAQPSAQPTAQPSVRPTAQPSAQPSPVGSSQPTPSPSSFAFMQCEDESLNCCNGLDTICDFRVDEIFYASVHNAMATFEDGSVFAPNHQFQLEGALEAGYRGINLDVCNCNGEYQLCHGICNIGARNPAETFRSINSFLVRILQ